METYRRTPRRFLSPGMLSLLQKFRLCVNLITECSRIDGAFFLAWIRDFLCPTLRTATLRLIQECAHIGLTTKIRWGCRNGFWFG